MKIQVGDVLPGIGIGDFRLGITKEELLGVIGNDYVKRQGSSAEIIEIENATFWVSGDERVQKIEVRDDFIGKYKNLIGLGSTLEDVRKYVENYVEVDYTYELESTGEIYFVLVKDGEEISRRFYDENGDNEELDELKIPIGAIGVFLEDELKDGEEKVLDKVIGKEITNILTVGGISRDENYRDYFWYCPCVQKIYFEFEDILVKFELYNQYGRLEIHRGDNKKEFEEGEIRVSMIDFLMVKPPIRGSKVIGIELSGGSEKYCRKIKIELENGQSIFVDAILRHNIWFGIGRGYNEIKQRKWEMEENEKIVQKNYRNDIGNRRVLKSKRRKSELSEALVGKVVSNIYVIGIVEEIESERYHFNSRQICIEFGDMLIKVEKPERGKRLRIQEIKEVEDLCKRNKDMVMKLPVSDFVLNDTMPCLGNMVKEIEAEGGTENNCQAVRIVLGDEKTLYINSESFVCFSELQKYPIRSYS